MNRISLIIILFLQLLFVSCERPTDSDVQNDHLPPAPPTGLRFYFATDGEILIEWDRNTEPDIKGYNIFRSINNSVFEKVDFTTNDFYLDDSLNYEDEYTYRITATDIFGEESSPGDTISAKPINRYRPYAPRFPEINARNWQGDKSVFLWWEASSDTDVRGYNIYRGDSESFTADSATLTGFSESTSFNDTTAAELYKKYSYKIKAVDKGGLLSDETSVVSDKILEIPEIVFPANGVTTPYFTSFRIIAAEVPAAYKIVVQTNEFFGEFWSRTISSSVVNDTLEIGFNPRYLEERKYYWRIITYSTSNEPNSISPLYNFIIKEKSF